MDPKFLDSRRGQIRNTNKSSYQGAKGPRGEWVLGGNLGISQDFLGNGICNGCAMEKYLEILASSYPLQASVCVHQKTLAVLGRPRETIEWQNQHRMVCIEATRWT